MQRWYRKLLAQDGVITIEFSFIYIIFIAFVFIIFEINKFIFIITAMDYSMNIFLVRVAFGSCLLIQKTLKSRRVFVAQSTKLLKAAAHHCITVKRSLRCTRSAMDTVL